MAVTVFCLLSLLLFAGKIIRVSIPILQKCYLPSSVVGGLWTATALTLLFQLGWLIMLCISLGALLLWLIPTVIICYKNRKAAA